MKKLIFLPLLGLIAGCNQYVGDFETTACVNGKRFAIVGRVYARDDHGYKIGENTPAAHVGSCRETVEVPES